MRSMPTVTVRVVVGLHYSELLREGFREYQLKEGTKNIVHFEKAYQFRSPYF